MELIKTLKNDFIHKKGQATVEYIMVFIAIAVIVLIVFKGLAPVDTKDNKGNLIAKGVSYNGTDLADTEKGGIIGQAVNKAIDEINK